MSPRVDPDERRQEILDAALRCFVRTGYQGTSMQDIVEESGLSKGTLYWYFDSKQALFMELFDRIVGQMLEPVAVALDAPGSPVERLHRLSAAVNEVSIDGEEWTAMPLTFLLEIWQEKDFMVHYTEMVNAFAEQVEGIIEEGIAAGEFRPVPAGPISMGLMALYDGLFLYAMTGLSRDFAAECEAMMELVLAGLGADKQV
jgi:AcrR family transcriptional regulator